MADQALHFKTISELVPLLRRGDVSPVELAECFLERIERFEAETHAFITVTASRARADAKAAEVALRNGNNLGPLHGIPIALKDLCDTAGIRTTSGSQGREAYVPETSCTVARKLARAGTVLLGKTNLEEFAFGPHGLNDYFGTPPNPWDKDRVPGGSSSGSGVAVAAGLAPAAIGTDTGGSVRIPSAFCGIVGLKTTPGRIGTAGITPLSWSLDSVGPLVRCVEDAALVYEAIAGPELGDPSAYPVPLEGAVERLKQDVKGMQVRIARKPFFEGADPEVISLVEAAIEQLAELGVGVDEMVFPEAEEAEREPDNLVLLRAEAFAYHRKMLADAPHSFGSRVRARLEADPGTLAADLIDIQRRRDVLLRTSRERLASVDAVVAPTMLTPAPRIDELDRGEPVKLMTRLVNWLGLCAVSVPCGFTSNGLPVGLQLIGKPFDEHTILHLAYAYEQATNWRTCRPPGF
ncbi:MAG: amidase [bacterium]|nr:amidase [bacterium]